VDLLFEFDYWAKS